MSDFSSTALVRDAAPSAAGVVACLSAAALALGGGVASVLALVAGATLAGLSVLAIARGLGAMLAAGTSAAAANRWAIITFTLRHGAVAGLAYLALRAGLPAPWLLAGVTAWPLALAVAGFKSMATAERT